MMDQNRFDDNDAALEEAEGAIELDHTELVRRLLRRPTDKLITRFWTDAQGEYHLSWQAADGALLADTAPPDKPLHPYGPPT